MKQHPPDPGDASERPEQPPREEEPTHTFAAEPMPEPDAANGNGSAPDSYGVDSIAAVARGPRSVFAHWELSGPGSARLRERLGDGCRWRLRLTDTETGRPAEIAVDPDAGNHYLKVQPGGRYLVELGVVATGVFRPVCRSDECRVPPEAPSPEGPVVWARLGDTVGGERAPAPRAPRAAPSGSAMPGLAWDPALGGAGSSGLPLAHGDR